MIINLFSIFDPSTSTFLSLNWTSSFLSFIFLPILFWILQNRTSLIWFKIIFYLHSEIKILINLNFINKGNSIIFISLFSFILFNNLLGLFPYIFTCSRHITLTLSLSLPLWITFILFGWLNFSQHIFIHIIPQRTPTILMPFIVIIELTRNIIRPGTLAIRLSANIIAGHLLLTLLGNTGPQLSTILIFILIFTQIILLLLETSVALIQSYVFIILSVLYSSETN